MCGFKTHKFLACSHGDFTTIQLIQFRAETKDVLKSIDQHDLAMQRCINTGIVIMVLLSAYMDSCHSLNGLTKKLTRTFLLVKKHI